MPSPLKKTKQQEKKYISPYNPLSKPLLFLTLIFLLGKIDGNVGHSIPGVVDTNEQQHNRHRTDDEECQCWIAWQHNRRNDERCIGDERKCHMPQPVFQHWFI